MTVPLGVTLLESLGLVEFEARLDTVGRKSRSVVGAIFRKAWLYAETITPGNKELHALDICSSELECRNSHLNPAGIAQVTEN